MVSGEDLSTGRVNQKKLTRKALLDATVRLIERGEHPRLAAVAAEAGVSRATAYRYFPSERALLLEAPLARGFAPPDEVLVGLEDASVEDRAVAIHRYVFAHAVENESHFRLFLSSIHETAARDGTATEPLRAGRRRKMFEQALAPARSHVSAANLRKLRDALVVMTGIDSLIVLRDVCGLTPDVGRRRMEWAIRRLVTATIGDP